MSNSETESRHKRVGDRFGGHASLYEAARPTYPNHFIRYVAHLVTEQGTVWDCATGTGQAAKLLASYFTEVYATDINADQIRVAKEKNKRENIFYSQQSAENTNFSDQSFDMVCVAQALHWFDYQKFWAEVRRVLKPNAFFVAWGYDWTKVSSEIDILVQTNLVEILAPFWAEKAKILWGGYRVDIVAFPFERIKIPEFKIQLHWNLHQFFAYLRSWSATQAAIKKFSSDEFLLKAKNKVAQAWGDAEKVRVIEMPLHALMGQNK